MACSQAVQKPIIMVVCWLLLTPQCTTDGHVHQRQNHAVEQLTPVYSGLCDGTVVLSWILAAPRVVSCIREPGLYGGSTLRAHQHHFSYQTIHASLDGASPRSPSTSR
jgi:hypothetical protein